MLCGCVLGCVGADVVWGGGGCRSGRKVHSMHLLVITTTSAQSNHNISKWAHMAITIFGAHTDKMSSSQQLELIIMARLHDGSAAGSHLYRHTPITIGSHFWPGYEADHNKISRKRSSPKGCVCLFSNVCFFFCSLCMKMFKVLVVIIALNLAFTLPTSVTPGSAQKINKDWCWCKRGSE